MGRKYPFRFKETHHCDLGLMCCMDFRFWQECVQFIKDEFGISDFDFPSPPGAGKGIIEESPLAELCVEVVYNLHQANKLVLIHHQDCGAYGGSSRFDGNAEAEQEFHEDELRKSGDIIRKKYPNKEIILIYAKLVDNGESIEFIQVK